MYRFYHDRLRLILKLRLHWLYRRLRICRLYRLWCNILRLLIYRLLIHRLLICGLCRRVLLNGRSNRGLRRLISRLLRRTCRYCGDSKKFEWVNSSCPRLCGRCILRSGRLFKCRSGSDRLLVSWMIYRLFVLRSIGCIFGLRSGFFVDRFGLWLRCNGSGLLITRLCKRRN